MRNARRARPDGNDHVTRAIRGRGDSAAAGLRENVPDAPARVTRRTALVMLAALGVVVLVALVLNTPGAGAHGSSDAPAILAAIRAEFGTGELAGCFAGIARRESRYNARAANWTDRHADGSRGSFGALQIGALWRAPGETVPAFARRMFVPRENVRLGRRIWERYGLAPWGGSCS